MGFWIYMLAMDMLIPVIMLIFGGIFRKKAPKEINYAYGYRTARSMKNDETWEFAHRYLGRLWFAMSIICIVVTVAVMLFFIGTDKDTVGIVGTVIMFGSLFSIMLSVILTENALKKAFDKDGNKIY